MHTVSYCALYSQCHKLSMDTVGVQVSVLEIPVLGPIILIILYICIVKI